MGYHRADGSVGTANYWLVIPLVFCENLDINVLKDALSAKLGFAQPRGYETEVDSPRHVRKPAKLLKKY